MRLKVADAVEVFINELVVMVGGRSVHEGDVAVEVNIRVETTLNKQLHGLGQHSVLKLDSRDGRG